MFTTIKQKKEKRKLKASGLRCPGFCWPIVYVLYLSLSLSCCIPQSTHDTIAWSQTKHIIPQQQSHSLKLPHFRGVKRKSWGHRGRAMERWELSGVKGVIERKKTAPRRGHGCDLRTWGGEREQIKKARGKRKKSNPAMGASSCGRERIRQKCRTVQRSWRHEALLDLLGKGQMKCGACPSRVQQSSSTSKNRRPL